MSHDNFIYGIHAVKILLLKQPHRVKELFVQENRQDAVTQEIVQLALSHEIVVHHLDRKQLEKKVGEAVHQGIVARVQGLLTLSEENLWNLLDEIQEPPFLLILDQIQDPHNLGACLRSADAFGVHAVIVPKDHSATLTPVVHKVASGATVSIPFITVSNLARVMRELKKRNIWLVGADSEAKQNLYDADLPTSIAIVMGAEGIGLRKLTKESCDLLLKIPMKGVVESLNVSVATGIFLFCARNNQK